MEPLLYLRESKLEIEKRLGYSFKNEKLLEQAFIHKSYFYENGASGIGHNERLEFLGDAVLQLLVSDYLFRNHPEKQEGELSQYRARLVDALALAGYSEKVGISEFLALGKGERKQEKKGSLLADLFEAVLGAIYLDSGVEEARQFLFSQIAEVISETMNSPAQSTKSLLQEWAQKNHQTLPEYVVIEESGPDHKRFFRIEVKLQAETIGVGEGFSKKEAERKAAEDAMKRLL